MGFERLKVLFLKASWNGHKEVRKKPSNMCQDAVASLRDVRRSMSPVALTGKQSYLGNAIHHKFWMLSNCILLSDVYLLENDAILVFNQGFRLRTRPLVSPTIDAYNMRKLVFVKARNYLRGYCREEVSIEGKLTGSGFVLHCQPFKDIGKCRIVDI